MGEGETWPSTGQVLVGEGEEVGRADDVGGARGSQWYRPKACVCEERG